MTSAQAANRRFGKHVGMPIALSGRTEHVFMSLQRWCDTPLQDQRVADDLLIRAAKINARRVYRFRMAEAAQLKRFVVDHDAAVPLLLRRPDRGPATPALAVVPEDA